MGRSNETKVGEVPEPSTYACVVKLNRSHNLHPERQCELQSCLVMLAAHTCSCKQATHQEAKANFAGLKCKREACHTLLQHSAPDAGLR